jgi:hypothetical protein
VGLNHTCFSYHGTMWVSAVACRNMMPDPGFYADCIRASFAELVAASVVAAAPPAPRRKPVLKAVAKKRAVAGASA